MAGLPLLPSRYHVFLGASDGLDHFGFAFLCVHNFVTEELVAFYYRFSYHVQGL
jgi:hypothetical protein